MKKQIEYKTKIEKVFQYDFPGDGGVIIYKVVPSDDLPLSSFFIAALDDTSTELVWGVGDTPQGALRAAEEEWDRIMPYQKNPFLIVFQTSPPL